MAKSKKARCALSTSTPQTLTKRGRGIFLGGITKPKPYITIEDLKNLRKKLHFTPKGIAIAYDKGMLRGFDLFLKAAAKIARERK